MGGYRPVPYIPDMAKLNEEEIRRNVIAKQQAEMKMFCADTIGKPGHDFKDGMEVVKYSANEKHISNPVHVDRLKAAWDKAQATRERNASNVALSQNQTTNQETDVHALVSAELQKRNEEAKAKKKRKNKKNNSDPLSVIKDEVQQVETNKQHYWGNTKENTLEVCKNF